MTLFYHQIWLKIQYYNIYYYLENLPRNLVENKGKMKKEETETDQRYEIISEQKRTDLDK